MMFLLSVFVGLVTGFLSGLGVGGTLLMILYSTSVLKLSQQVSQGINLIFFIPISLCALYFHRKNNFINKSATLYALIPGIVTSVLASLFATSASTWLLKKAFGVFLILIGTREVFKKKL